MMISSTKPKNWLQMSAAALTICMLAVFGFLIVVLIILSIIPTYLANQSVPKTKMVQTTVTLNNYTLDTGRSSRKRDLTLSAFVSNTTENLTLSQAKAEMKSNVQVVLEQQLQLGDKKDRFNILILNMLLFTSDTSNMRIVLDLKIIYTKECRSCNRRRQEVIRNQLGSNKPLPTPIRILIQYPNGSFEFSVPRIVSTPILTLQSIVVVTQIVPITEQTQATTEIITTTNTRLFNKLRQTNFVVVVETMNSDDLNVFGNKETSANAKNESIPLPGNNSLISEIVQWIEKEINFYDSSTNVTITIDDKIIQIWYFNNTIQCVTNFTMTFSSSCDSQCMNQRGNHTKQILSNLKGFKTILEPFNSTITEISLIGNSTEFSFNFTIPTTSDENAHGTIINSVAPTFTIV